MQQSYVGCFLIFSVVFGFYLGPVRTDQILILLFGSLALFNLIQSKKSVTTRDVLVVCSIIFFITIGVLSFTFNKNQNFSLLVIAQMENYFSLGAIYLIWLFYFKNGSCNHLIKIHKTFIFAMCIVTILNFLVFFFDFNLLSIFHVSFIGNERPDLQGVRLLDLLISSGRYPGTFGQIFEAGTAYFLAIFSLLSLRNFYSSKTFWTISFIFLVSGGLLTGSKIFVACSLIVIFYKAFRFSKIIFSFLLSISLFSLAVVTLYNLNLPWQFNRLIRKVTLENIFDIYTSNRFGEGSSILVGINDIFEKSPIFGMGFGYLSNSDFALYEVIAVSGVTGILIYFLIVTLQYFDARTKQDVLHSLFILLFICAISMSAPAVTANKISFLLLICLLSLKRIYRKT